MKKIYSGFAISFMAFALSAQQYVHQVVFLNEGKYDYINSTQVVPVTLGTYNPATKIYGEFATIPNARFGSDVIIDQNSIYVAADSLLLKYDKFNMQPTGTKVVKGIRKLAVWNDMLLITRGDVVALDSYFQVYDKNNLDFIYELGTADGPVYASEGIGTIGDTAYFAIGNGFNWGNEVGKIGIVDLNTKTYKGEIDLGPDAKNPDNMMIDGNMVYTLNNKDWSGSSISLLNVVTGDIFTTSVAGGGGCGSSALAAEYIFYMEYSVGKVARFNVLTKSILDTLASTLPFYGMVNDGLNNIFYATTTDYSTSGKAYIMQYNGLLSDSFNVGVSAGSMALDIRLLSGIYNENPSPFTVSPNPNDGMIEIGNIPAEVSSIKILNLLGETVILKRNTMGKSAKIDISEQPSGFYFLTVETVTGSATVKLVKK